MKAEINIMPGDYISMVKKNHTEIVSGRVIKTRALFKQQQIDIRERWDATTTRTTTLALDGVEIIKYVSGGR